MVPVKIIVEILKTRSGVDRIIDYMWSLVHKTFIDQGNSHRHWWATKDNGCIISSRKNRTINYMKLYHIVFMGRLGGFFLLLYFLFLFSLFYLFISFLPFSILSPSLPSPSLTPSSHSLNKKHTQIETVNNDHTINHFVIYRDPKSKESHFDLLR